MHHRMIKIFSEKKNMRIDSLEFIKPEKENARPENLFS